LGARYSGFHISIWQGRPRKRISGLYPALSRRERGIGNSISRDPEHVTKCLMLARPVQSTRSVAVGMLLDRLTWAELSGKVHTRLRPAFYNA
jgi:hypothetical protein